MTNSLQFIHFFDSAHMLIDSPSLTTKKCAKLHGHTYKVVVKLETYDLIDGMVVDYGKLKEIIDQLDHAYINDVFKLYPEWINVQCTAENIARFLFELLNKGITQGVAVTSVSICEGYKGEDRASYATYQA